MGIEVHDSQLFDTFQVTYNILDQSLLEVADDLIGNGKRIIIKEALANGRIFRNKNYPEYAYLYQTLEQMAKKYEVGVDAVALRFCVDSIRPFLVLSGASEDIQIKENLKSNRIKLEEEDINILKDFKITPDSYWSERKQLRWN
jgi:aryl-alcohol dehydrogenase-like predicted oxidoreductase